MLSAMSALTTWPPPSQQQRIFLALNPSQALKPSLILSGARKRALFQKASVTKSDSPERSPFLKLMVPTREHDRKTGIIAHHIHRFHLHPRGRGLFKHESHLGVIVESCLPQSIKPWGRPLMAETDTWI